MRFGRFYEICFLHSILQNGNEKVGQQPYIYAMSKVYIANDTSRYHGGSAAVIKSLRSKLEAAGHEVIGTTLRPQVPEEGKIRQCDVMIVNGEGAMAQEATSWHVGRAAGLLKGLAYAKQLGKKVYLINSVWFHMQPGWTSILRSLDGLWVREISSQNEMLQGQGVKPEVYVDLSYSCPLDSSAEYTDFAGHEVVGTFYRRNMPFWGTFDHTHPMFTGMPRISLGGQAEKKDEVTDWSFLVRSLRTASLYVTGQHHGVYAACKARIPFVIFKVNTHKLSGLFAWAGVAIPIAQNRRQLVKALAWARKNRAVYERLFDWMEEQPVWQGI